MAAIKGQNLRLLLTTEQGGDARCIAASQTCTVHLALQMEEDTTKDNDNDWIDYEPVGINWDAQAQALVVVDAEDTGGVQIEDLLQVGLEVLVQFSPTSGTKNREAGQSIVEGYAIISDLQINATNQELSTYTVQLTGSGDLSFVDPNE